MSDERGELAGGIDRRGFLATGAGALAATTALADGQPAAGGEVPKKTSQPSALSTRTLGRTGAKVTILNLGTWMSPGGERLLRYAWASGIRYVDTAKSYGSEPMIGRWMRDASVPRNQLFLATKDQPNEPGQLIEQLDQRLAALQTDYVDLIYLHALGDRNFELEMAWLTSPELKATADAIRKSGKAKYRRFFDPSSGAAPVAPGCRARRVPRCDHAAEQSLACGRRRYEPSARRSRQAWNRPGVDEAGRGSHEPRRDRNGPRGEEPRCCSRLTRRSCTRSGPTSDFRRSASRCAIPSRSARTRRRRECSGH